MRKIALIAWAEREKGRERERDLKELMLFGLVDCDDKSVGLFVVSVVVVVVIVIWAIGFGRMNAWDARMLSSLSRHEWFGVDSI